MSDRSSAGIIEAAKAPFRRLRIGRAELLLLATAAISLLAGAVLFPSEFLHAAPECPLHRWTSFYCAGCGTTRAIVALLGGGFFNGRRHAQRFDIAKRQRRSVDTVAGVKLRAV
jgi:hypothetical protein